MHTNTQLKKHFFSFITIAAVGLLSACSSRNDSGSSDSSSSQLSLTQFAGIASNIGNTNGTGANASFDFPSDVTTDGTNLYVVDTENNLIRKIVISSGAVSTFAGSGTLGNTDGTGTAASFYFPRAIATDGTNLFVADSNAVIRKIVISTQVVTSFLGTPGIYGTADGTGTAAEFDSPIGMTVVGSDLYIADMWNNTIRKAVISTGVVTTFAGDGTCGSTDATGTSASFCHPYDITNDGTYLYLADTDNSTIRQIDISTGAVTTIAGTAGNYGYNDATGAAAQFNYPESLTYSGGYLYVVDTQSSIIRKVDVTNGATTTFAGTAAVHGYADGTGSAIEFALNPSGMTTDGTNLFITDTYNGTVRKIVISSAVSSTLAGSPLLSILDSTNGTSTSARFNNIQSMASDGTNLYVVDLENNTIRKIVISTGVVTTFAGSPGAGSTLDGTGTAARFNMPSSIVYTGGYLYVTEYLGHVIRRISTSTAVVTTFVGDGSAGHTSGTGTSAQISYPTALATDGTNLYVGGSSAIQKVVISSAAVSDLAGISGSYGYNDAIGASAQFGWLYSFATDGTDLYVVDDFNNIRKVVISTGAVTTVAGSLTSASEFIDGTGTAARFFYPTGISLSGSTLYIADQGNNSIRMMNTSTMAVTTLLGSMANELDRTGATSTTAAVSNPICVYADSTVGLFIGNISGIKRVQ